MVGRVLTDFFRVQIPRPLSCNLTQRMNVPCASWSPLVALGSDRHVGIRKVKAQHDTYLSLSYTMPREIQKTIK